MSDNASLPYIEGGSRSRVRLARVSTTQAIVNELVQEILDGTFEAGADLREVELAARFGTSRQSLRTALAELTFRGLATSEPHRSVRVAIVTRRDFRDIDYTREIIEGEAMRWLVRHPEGWPPIEAALDRLERLTEDSPWAEIAEADVAFHAATVDALGSPRLSRAHRLLGDEMRLILVPARHYLSHAEMATIHGDLLAQIKTGDSRVAMKRLRAHLDLGTERLLGYLPDDGVGASRT